MKWFIKAKLGHNVFYVWMLLYSAVINKNCLFLSFQQGETWFKHSKTILSENVIDISCANNQIREKKKKSESSEMFKFIWTEKNVCERHDAPTTGVTSFWHF